MRDNDLIHMFSAWIQWIKILYSSKVAGGTLSETRVVDMVVVHEWSPVTLEIVGIPLQLQPTHKFWHFTGIDIGNLSIRSILQGDHVGVWARVLAGARVLIFVVHVRIFFASGVLGKFLDPVIIRDCWGILYHMSVG